MLLVQRPADDDELVAARLERGGVCDVADLDAEPLAADGLGDARGDLGGVAVRGRVDDERIGMGLGGGGAGRSSENVVISFMATANQPRPEATSAVRADRRCGQSRTRAAGG